MTVSTIDSARFEAAGARFVAFFTELNLGFVEREELLVQIALGLLSREHVLMTGPPGTAKSGVAAAVLRRVFDEKTGAPSLYARQFTESTVYTDLVGPINFKTLMETGHTEHFTDDGMLGAVHAFLDEVFDGRDMLLRSTLNLLQERELKQGGQTTRGQIECALMTTNRYLAEVLEGSRETLLAFVDRIAFVSFVPRGFANNTTLAGVLKRQVQGTSRLGSTLSIQDLDVLQAVVDRVEVPDEVLDGLSTLLGSLSDELAAAERADPQFLATRYLSTRTAVRLGRLLRAICVFDRLFLHRDRSLKVEGRDLAGLRSSLVLAGPKPEALNALLAKETDPRERRQLSIIRTERQIFDRCLKALPPIVVPERVAPKPEFAELASAPANIETAKLVEATRVLAAETALRPTDAVGESLLGNAVAELGERALRMGLTSSAPENLGLDVERTVEELLHMAENVETAASSARPTARWLRGKALRLLEEAATLGGANAGSALDDLQEPPKSLELTIATIDARFLGLAKLIDLRDRLRAAGADETDVEAAREKWGRAVERAEADAAGILDAGFQGDVALALERNPSDALEGVLSALAKPFELLDQVGQKLAAMGGDGARLKAAVVAPRLRPLVAEAFARLAAPDRIRLVSQVEKLLATLASAGLRGVLSPQDMLAMTAEALVRSAESIRPTPSGPPDHATYRQLRQEDQRVPGAYTLLEIALLVRERKTFDLGQPENGAAALAELARDLPEPTQMAVAEVDLERLERVVTFFEQWATLVEGQGTTTEDKLRARAQSRFFHVIADERALLRTSLEIRLVADVFPRVASRADELRRRVQTLEEQSHESIRTLLQKRSEEAWTSMLKS